MKRSNWKPAGYHTLTPYLGFKSASRAIEFYIRAFGAVENFRLTEPGGKIGHAEIRIGDSYLMLADEYPDFGHLSAQTLGGSPVKLHMYVEDVDALVRRAVDAGATLLRPVKDEFHGNRGGVLADPFGYHWMVTTQIEELSPQEMQRRFAAAFS